MCVPVPSEVVGVVREAVDALERVVSTMPGGGERRSGQHRMCRAVASALDQNRHLVVAAGTGTGKSMAYLVPLVAIGSKAVVATATKALQDQLAAQHEWIRPSPSVFGCRLRVGLGLLADAF